MCKVAIKSGKHVFIEKPISNTVEEAEESRLANEYNVKGK
jgi:predicted dehydrogenase